MSADMQSVRFICWQEDDAWLGYLVEHPDYWTQGETLEDLKEHLKDLHQNLPFVPTASL